MIWTICPLLNSGDLVFDAIIGRNALTRHADKAGAAAMLARLLSAAGVISLAETVPSHTQRLYKLVDLATLGSDLAERVVKAEEAIYSQSDDPMVNWDEEDLAPPSARPDWTPWSRSTELPARCW